MRFTAGDFSGVFNSTALILLILTSPVYAEWTLGPEEFVRAGGVIIDVPGYSVPSFACWDDDDLEDLIVGEGSGSFPNARVRVYLNVGTAAEPQFSTYSYVQAEGVDLICPGSG